jgi:hypothetical protein
MQWPQAMHPNRGWSDNTAFPLTIKNSKSLHTEAHFPHPLHFCGSMMTVAASSALLVGIDMAFGLMVTLRYEKSVKIELK